MLEPSATCCSPAQHAAAQRNMVATQRNMLQPSTTCLQPGVSATSSCNYIEQHLATPILVRRACSARASRAELDAARDAKQSLSAHLGNPPPPFSHICALNPKPITPFTSIHRKARLPSRIIGRPPPTGRASPIGRALAARRAAPRGRAAVRSDGYAVARSCRDGRRRRERARARAARARRRWPRGRAAVMARLPPPRAAPRRAVAPREKMRAPFHVAAGWWGITCGGRDGPLFSCCNMVCSVATTGWSPSPTVLCPI
jgi:hypothetical protein